LPGKEKNEQAPLMRSDAGGTGTAVCPLRVAVEGSDGGTK